MDENGFQSKRLPHCSESGCARDADFFVYDGDREAWQAICKPHARRLHASIELHAWLDCGYLKPAQLGRPDEPPTVPPHRRADEFQEEIRRLMGWG